jgi:hypothetical protein
MKRFIVHNRKKIFKGILIGALAVVSFAVAHKLGTMERGYDVIGGELLVPLLVIFGKDIFKMLAEPFKVMKEVLGDIND